MPTRSLAPLAPLAALLLLALSLACPPTRAQAVAADRLPRVPDRYEPGTTRTWTFTQGGRRIGAHSFRYDGPVTIGARTAHAFSGRTELAVPGLEQPSRALVELLVTDRGAPLHALLRSGVGAVVSELDARFAGSSVEVVVRQGGGDSRREIGLAGPVWFQANNTLGGFDLLLSLNPQGPDEPLALQLLSANVLRPIQYTTTWVEGLPGGGARVFDSLGETLTLDADGHLLRLEVPAAQLVCALSDEPALDFELSSPAPLTAGPELDREEVSLTHGEVTLAGTLTRPPGATGRLPALAFLSGSGPQDRNGFSSGIDVGTHELLDRLTAEGFAVLRVDDRNVGASSGPLHGGLSGLVDDALACVDFLLARDDVDPTRVGLIGHSEGATTAPIVALRRPRLAALVLLAGIARPLPEVMLDQNALALTLDGVTGAAQEAALAEIAEVFERLASDEALFDGDLPAEFAPLIAERRWFREHARHDPLATLAQVGCPVLVLQGGTDFQVSPERDAEVLAATLDEAGVPHELVVFPGLDHLFKRTPGERSGLADYFLDRRVDEQFLATLSTWLRRTLAAPDDDG